MDIRIQEIIMAIIWIIAQMEVTEICWIQTNTNSRITNNDYLKYIYYSILPYFYPSLIFKLYINY
jgi:hypothetical protein